MRSGVRLGRWLTAAVVLGLAVGCETTAYRARFEKPKAAEADEGAGPARPGASFVKCHMKDGRVIVLDRWQFDPNSRTVSGEGIAYDAERVVIQRGIMTVPLDQVALVETDRPERLIRGNVVALGVTSALSIALGAYCLANTKACFGSCPTFYADDGHGMALEAEGFSASVARVLEATDVDAMYTASTHQGELHLLLTNEALETHAIRHVEILAAQRPPGGRVVRDGDRYFPATHFEAPTSCRAPSGDCLGAIRAVDKKEYLSPADPHDLAARETIDLELPPGKGRRGLVIAARNSLLNTFLFYQTLAYMGRRAGDLMTRLERGGPAVEAVKGFGRALGNLDVEVRLRNGSWQHAGAFAEVGPIAREVQMVPLPPTGPGPVHVRLRMAKGNFRVDYVAVADLGHPITPTRVQLDRVLRHGHPDPDALARLRDTTRYLVTGPGDAYDLYFRLPAGNSELFLSSTGYYYEWMRQRWLKEQNDQALRQLLLHPDAALRRLAPLYKRVEPDMDRLFWSSRVRLPPAARRAP